MEPEDQVVGHGAQPSRRPGPVTLAGNRVALLHDGAQCLPAMLDAIASAKHEILLEMYWFGSDRTGRRFAEALADKARGGVRVCVIYDSIGSIEAEESMFDSMRAAGCRVHEYNPVAPWRSRFRIGVVHRRDHRKILIVDGRVAMTGGVNLGDPWAPEDEGGQGWRDDMIRIEGPAAPSMRELFLNTWRRVGEQGPGSATSGELQSQPHSAIRGPSPVQVLANHGPARRVIRQAYLTELSAARKTAYIANSYFVPDRIVRRALSKAAQRGVDVRVLVPGISDVPAVYYAGRKLYSWLMSRGIRLYEWQNTILHAKTAAIDDRWATVGTYNLDYVSWRFNLEVNVAVHDPTVARALRTRIEQDCAQSLEIKPEQWRFRPPAERLLEQFFYLFRKIL